MASTLSSDLELLIYHFVRHEYEQKYNKQHIPVALKYIMIQFSQQIIKCDMLMTFKEDLGFYKLLSSKLKSQIIGFEVLYKASDHNFSARKFHELCDGVGPTITIIKSNFGNIFGGYTSKKWPKTTGSSEIDYDAFLFLIRSNDKNETAKCPLYFGTSANIGIPFAIHHFEKSGPIFGSGFDIRIADSCNAKMFNETFQKTYDTKDCNLSGSNRRREIWGSRFKGYRYFFKVIEYYVIKIKC